MSPERVAAAPSILSGRRLVYRSIAMTDDDKRREPRHAAHVSVKLTRQGVSSDLLTDDVSFRGAFVRTDEPPKLRQLVKLEVELPGGHKIEAHAMVVHVRPAGPGVVPGVGVQFWGQMSEQRAWERFVQDLGAHRGPQSSRRKDKVRRSSQRFRIELPVNLGAVAGVTRDVSETGMAIRTEKAFPLGMRVHLVVTTREGDEVGLDAIVRRAIHEDTFRGVGVEFTTDDPEARRAIFEAARTVQPDEGAVFIDPDDPGLH